MDPYGQGTQSPPHPQTGFQKTGLAIASMILGIVAIPASFLLIGLLMAPVGLALGITALIKASKRPFEYGGKGFAIAGVVTSATALLFFLPIIAAIAIPNLLAARRAANEGSAVSALRTIHGAQEIYLATHSAKDCADLRSLGAANLIDSVTATGTRSGYSFEISGSGSGECDTYATPLSLTDGTHSFVIMHDGVIRGADKKGRKADKTDPVLGYKD